MSRIVRLGVYVSNREPESGGAHSFEQAVLDGLSSLKSAHSITIFYHGELSCRRNPNFEYVRVGFLSAKSALDRVAREFKRILIKVGLADSNDLKFLARKHKIELMWFATASYQAVDTPFVYTVWDLNHRLHPEFPEISGNGEWQHRERHYTSVLPFARKIITGLKLGKKQISEFYDIAPEKISVVRFPIPDFPPEESRTECSSTNNATIDFKKNKPFIFYPANFWPHKDHLTVINALKFIRESGWDLELILTGHDTGGKAAIVEKLKTAGQSDSVKFLGFVGKDTLRNLYQNAFALVYASHCGPDNLPPLEAFHLGCPVICARYDGAEEQLGDGALYFRKGDPVGIVTHLLSLNDGARRQKMIAEGKLRVQGWGGSAYVAAVFRELELG